jgi:hypothetical protein
MKNTKQLRNSARVFVAAAATLIPLAIASTPALAQTDDSKAFPGNTCQGTSPTNEAKLSRGGSFTWNSLGTSSATVVCPIFQRYPSDNSITKVFAVVSVYNTQGTLSCTLRAHNFRGDIVDSSTKTTSSTGGYTILFIPTISRGLTYSMSCILPPNGSVQTYQVGGQ